MQVGMVLLSLLKQHEHQQIALVVQMAPVIQEQEIKLRSCTLNILLTFQ